MLTTKNVVKYTYTYLDNIRSFRKNRIMKRNLIAMQRPMAYNGTSGHRNNLFDCKNCSAFRQVGIYLRDGVVDEAMVLEIYRRGLFSNLCNPEFQIRLALL